MKISSKDFRVCELEEGIIDAQVREIEEMTRHIARIGSHPPTSKAPDLASFIDRRRIRAPGSIRASL
jgi:uncharacterized protein (DUF305 family)